MSGGSWNYVYARFDEVANDLIKSKIPQRRALGRKIAKIAVAMKDIEWVDSADSAPGDEFDAIKAALGNEYLRCTSEEIIMEAEESARKLAELIAQAKEVAK